MRRIKVCKHAEGCEKIAHDLGWCPMHARRVRKQGHPGPVGKLTRSKSVCLHSGCESSSDVKGMCRSHYKNEWAKSRRANRSEEQKELELSTKRARYWRHRDENLEAMREYGVRNKERMATRNKAWRLEHPEHHRAHAARRRYQAALGMSDQDKKDSVAWRRIIRDDPCLYCGELSEEMHDDHYLALSRGGTDHWFNIIRSCRKCNLRKNAKPAEEFFEILRKESDKVNE